MAGDDVVEDVVVEDDVVEDSEEEQPFAQAKAWYDELREQVHHAMLVKEMIAGVPFVNPETNDLYYAGSMWSGRCVVDPAAITQCIFMRLREAATLVKGKKAQAAKKRANALAAQVVRGEGQVDEPKPVANNLFGLQLVRLQVFKNTNAHAAYEPPRHALRRLPSHLRYLMLPKSKHDIVMTMLCSDGTAMPCAMRVRHEQDDVRRIAPHVVIQIFRLLAQNLPVFFDDENGVQTRPQVSCAGHTTVFSSALRQKLSFAQFRWCQVVGGSPRARMDVLVWLGRSGDDWYEFCTNYWPFLQRGVLLVYPGNIDAPGVLVYSDDDFQVSVIGGHRLKRCKDDDVFKKFLELRCKEPKMAHRRQVRRATVAKAMRACGVVGIGDTAADPKELDRLIKKFQRLLASFALEPCGQKRKRA